MTNPTLEFGYGPPFTPEIGQTTYVELISVKESIITPAIGVKTRTVLNPDGTTRVLTPREMIDTSINRLAFGKKKTSSNTTIAHRNPISSSIRIGTIQSAKYSLFSKQTNKIIPHRAIKAESEFRKLISNPVAQSFADCVNVPDISISCPNSTCPIDVAFIIDNTISMSTVLSALKSSLNTIADDFASLSQGNYRFSLLTFKNSATLVTSFPNACGNITQFKSDLASITASGGGNIPEASDIALEGAIDGLQGGWRESAQKIAILITDALPSGLDDKYDYTDRLHAQDIATKAANCGIKIISIVAIVTPTFDQDLYQIMKYYADITSGIYINSPTCNDIHNLLSSYILRLCNAFSFTTNCSGGENIIFNGTFDTGIAGWDVIDASDVTWDSVRRAARLSTNSIVDPTIEQTHEIIINDQDVIQIAFDIDNQTGIEIPVTCHIGDNVDTQDIAIGKSRLSFTGLVNADDIISYAISVHTPIGQPAYVDNIIACLYRNDDCLVGTNAITNGQFLSGVGGWRDSTDTLIADTTDPAVWDSEAFAIIFLTKFTVGHDPPPGYELVRQIVNNLIPSTVVTLIYDLLEIGPESTANRGYMVVVTDLLGNTIVSHTVFNSDVFSFPSRRSLTFTVPSDGSVKIDFKVGLFGGGARVRVRNIRMCIPIGACTSGNTTISFDDFLTSRGSWSGGIWLNNSGFILVNFSPGFISQTFSNLQPGLTLTVFADALQIGGLIIELTSGGVTNRLITDLDPGTKSHSIIVQDTGTVFVSITSTRRGINVSNILVCQENQACSGNITNVRSYIEWKGIPREPNNLFNILVRYKIRDPSNPFSTAFVTHASVSDGHTSIATPSSCVGAATCDFWKQNGSGGVTQSSITNQGLVLSNIQNINSGDTTNVSTRINWLWDIPGSKDGTVHDNLVTLYPEPPPGLIESIEFLLLMQSVTLIGGIPIPPVCVGPYSCTPDPADEFDVIIRYVNIEGLEREFKVTLSKDDLLAQTKEYTAPSWDVISSVGGGTKGDLARWESVKFVLDTVDGQGLDQCTTPISFSATGQGDLEFKAIIFSSKNNIFREGCDAEVVVESVQSGSSINEVQDIILPKPTGGFWTLSFDYNGVDSLTTLIPFDASAAQVRVKLINLLNINSPVNVMVTGNGESNDPFKVEFTGDLGGIDVPLLVASGDELTGASTAVVSTLVNGTKNERQTITNIDNVTSSFIVKFNGVNSIPIPHNASLELIESTLEAMSSIRLGNVTVSGLIANRSIAYRGPWFVVFKGTLAAQNVPTMSITNPGYEVTVDWQGGVGVNEQQRIMVVATGGTFTLKLYRPGDLLLAITGDIPFDATKEQVKDAIVNAASWLDSDDVSVSDDLDLEEPDSYAWIVEYKGSYAGANVPQSLIDSSQLLGGPISVTESIVGASFNEIIKLTIKRAKSGFYRLVIINDDVRESSNRIQYNTTANDLLTQLEAMDLFNSGDVEVEKLIVDDNEITNQFLLTFRQQLGEVTIVPKFIGTLLCDPIPLEYVPPPPYDYHLPDCCDLDDLSCQSGPLLCVPCDGDGDDTVEVCCQDEITESANVAKQLEFQRDLFDPNQKLNSKRMIVRDLAFMKGLNYRLYKPYSRDFETQTLREISYDAEIFTQSSIILIESQIDSDRTRQRVIEHIRSHREILPTRMFWPKNGFVEQSI